MSENNAELSAAELEDAIAEQKRLYTLFQCNALFCRRLAQGPGEELRRLQAELMRRQGWLEPIEE